MVYGVISTCVVVIIRKGISCNRDGNLVHNDVIVEHREPFRRRSLGIDTGEGDVFEEINSKAISINEKQGKRLIIMTNARTDINKFAVAGDICVGVSRAALEMMACEKPIIIAGNEGYIGIFEETKLETAIETNFCCRGLEMSNEELLYNDILKLVNTENKAEMGKYNREVVKKYYSIEKMVNDCECAYKKTLENKN